jgi:hypothetical protein
VAEEISGTIEAEMDRLRARTIEAEYRELLLKRDNERMARELLRLQAELRQDPGEKLQRMAAQVREAIESLQELIE